MTTYNHIRFLIQHDTASKRFRFRVVTTGGEVMGYFMHTRDAAAWCEAQA